MTARLRFELLGPVRAFRGDTELDLGSPQQRAMLAVLLLSEGRQVSVEDAASALWGEELPASGGTTVRTYIYRLRRVLAATQDSTDGVQIVSDGGGYRLVVDPDMVDAALFRCYVADARNARAVGDLAQAGEHLREGLALWHGTALAGVAGSFFDSQRTWLEQLRSTASEERLVVAIELGNHAEAVASLTVSVAEQPYRERLWELLMLALYRSGRQADALAAYRRVARLLDHELGLEPGPGLRELHARILAADPGLSAAEEPNLAPPTALIETPTPAQLPPDVGDFVGRGPEITTLTEHLQRPEGQCVVELTGSVGMGKTSVAIHTAHTLRAHFPDGQLYAELHTREGTTIDPADVLTGFLRALGVPDNRLPGTLSELTALWRTLLAERRMLIVLDDAASSEQVWPLLPSSPGCAVILTSARSLVALPVTHTAKLDALTPEDALRLFATIAGQPRVLAEPAATRRVLQHCSYQPLAIRIAAHWLMNRPTRTVGQLERHIDDELRQPLPLSEEYQAMEARYRRALARLGPELASICQLVSVPELHRLDGSSAAALLGLPVAHATRALEALVGANFLEADADGSYHFHEFLRRMIRRQALGNKGPAHDQAALASDPSASAPVPGTSHLLAVTIPAPPRVTGHYLSSAMPARRTGRPVTIPPAPGIDQPDSQHQHCAQNDLYARMYAHTPAARVQHELGEDSAMQASPTADHVPQSHVQHLTAVEESAVEFALFYPVSTGVSGTSVLDTGLLGLAGSLYHCTVDELREQAILADETGWTSLMMAEHHFELEGYHVIPNPLLLNVHLAAHTRHLRHGQMGLELPNWNPLRGSPKTSRSPTISLVVGSTSVSVEVTSRARSGCWVSTSTSRRLGRTPCLPILGTGRCSRNGLRSCVVSGPRICGPSRGSSSRCPRRG